MSKFIRNKVGHFVAALATIGAVALTPAFTEPVQAVGNVTVTVSYQGNACYVWGQSLSKWTAVISGNSNGYSNTVTVNGGSRSTTVSLPGGASYSVRIQSWCSGIFLGRTAGGNRWAYSSGYQPTWTFFAGILTG